MKTWKTISSKILLKHSRVTVYEDDVELPNGLQTKYLHFGDQGGSATVIAVNNKGKILVQKEYSYPPNKWLYQFPGGALDTGETPEEGGLRELKEEAGVGGKLRRIGQFYIDNRRRKDQIYVFVATGVYEAHANPDPEEVFETYWLSEEEVAQIIAGGERATYTMLASWAVYKNQAQFTHTKGNAIL